MIRVEIIANRSVEDNILEAMAKENAGKYYTKYPIVYGIGSTGPRMGDAIWPEENFAMVFWCDEDEARRIERAVAAVKAQFPNEGIKLFGLGQSAPGQAYAAPQTPGQAASAPDTAELPPSPIQAPPYDDPEDPNAE